VVVEVRAEKPLSEKVEANTREPALAKEAARGWSATGAEVMVDWAERAASSGWVAVGEDDSKPAADSTDADRCCAVPNGEREAIAASRLLDGCCAVLIAERRAAPERAAERVWDAVEKAVKVAEELSVDTPLKVPNPA